MQEIPRERQEPPRDRSGPMDRTCAGDGAVQMPKPLPDDEPTAAAEAKVELVKAGAYAGVTEWTPFRTEES